MPGDGRFYVNGLNGSTGTYLLDSQSPAELYQIALTGLGGSDGAHLCELARRNERDTRRDQALSVGDPRVLGQAGWGVVFPRQTDEAVYEALRPLLTLRRAQAGQPNEHYYREYRGADGLEVGETKQQFLSRHGVALGMPADPEFMPYYLLLVGSPDQIPFRFQYELDVEYAVGRISFATPEGYARYAAGVVAAETRAAPPPRQQRAILLAPRSPDDTPTRLSAESLVPPLATALRPNHPGWELQTVVGEEATKQRLAAAVAEAPTVLFTASHGMYFPPHDPRHRPHSGALLCSDWPGPVEHSGPIPEGFYFAAGDVPARPLEGTVAIHFACFGAGVPAEDDFPHERQLNRGRPLAAQSFVSALAQRLLVGGALAVVGHVERAWAYSFLNDRAQPQVQVFRAALGRILDGAPVGLAMEWFNQRYAALATALTGMLGKLIVLKKLDDQDLLETATLWTGHNDARGYVVLGDPAVRVRAAEPGTPLCESTVSPRARG